MGLRATLILLLTAITAEAKPVRVMVPHKDNLQHMAFWVAKQRGYFAEEGAEITVSHPANARETEKAFRAGEADAVVLPPPMALDLAAAGFPFLIVANLLRHDAANVVVSAAWAKSHPGAVDFKALKGARVGVAPGPVTRLKIAIAGAGMKETDFEIVVLPGEQQNAALGDGRVDALFAHTPYLENALVDQGAALAIHASRGDVPALSNLQIHTLAVTNALRDSAPEQVAALVRAITRAEKSIREDEKATVDTLAAAFPERDRKKLETIVALYRPAIPESPAVSAEALRASSLIFPAHHEMPDLSKVSFTSFVDASFTGGAPPSPKRAAPRAWLPIVGAGLAFALVLGIIWRRRSARR